MKAIRYDRYGGPEVLRLADMPEPRCGGGEVLIDVRAASAAAKEWTGRLPTKSRKTD